MLAQPSKRRSTIYLAAALTVAVGILGLTAGGLRLARAVGSAPVISPIPDQGIAYGATFATIALDSYVNDPDTADKDIVWAPSGNTNITVNVDVLRVATITYTAGWSGTENITFKATDPQGNSANDVVAFTVAANQPPVVSLLPKPIIPLGAEFDSINLDSYVSDLDHADSQITWSTSTGDGSKYPWIAIASRVATMTYPAGWTGTGSFIFTATDPAGASGSNSASFEVRRVLDIGTVAPTSVRLDYLTGVPDVSSWKVRRDSSVVIDPAVSGSGNSVVDSGLAENTSYTYEMLLKYNDGSSTGYLSTTTTTTLAAAPTALGAEAGQQAISLTATRFTNDTVNQAAYRFENVTTGADSGWQASPTWETGSLSCGTGYEVRVSLRSSAGAVTQPYTRTVYTAACPAPQGAPLPPVGEASVGAPAGEFPRLSVAAVADDIGSAPAAVVSRGVDDAGTPGNVGAPAPTGATNLTVEKIKDVFRELIVDGDLHPMPNAATLPPEPKTDAPALAALPPVVKETASSAPANVAAIQQRLQSYGAPSVPAAPAVTLDQAMRQAVRDFQRSVGINPIGVVGPRTARALNGEEFISNAAHVFAQDLGYGQRGEEVRQLQTRLRDQAFFPYDIPVTGWYGPVTRAAVSAFQALYQLPATGVLDAATRAALNVFSR